MAGFFLSTVRRFRIYFLCSLFDDYESGVVFTWDRLQSKTAGIGPVSHEFLLARNDVFLFFGGGGSPTS